MPRFLRHLLRRGAPTSHNPSVRIAGTIVDDLFDSGAGSPYALQSMTRLRAYKFQFIA